MRNLIKTRKFTACVAAVALCAGILCAGAVTQSFGARAANAAESATSILDKDGSAKGALDGTKLKLSPWADGSYSYQFRAQQLQFVFNKPIDASWAQEGTQGNYKVKDNVYLEFWIYSNRPQTEEAWGGDRQIELSSITETSGSSSHDYKEYHWNFSDVIFQRGDGGTKPYVAGKWNKARLKLTPKNGSNTNEVDLGAIRWMRMYYLFNTETYTDPVFISDMKLTTGTDEDPSIIREYMTPSVVGLPETLEMPADKTEGDVVTLPVPQVHDHDGRIIPESKIKISTFGPNAYEMKGKTIELEDGDGVYTTRYTVTDLMGVAATKEYTFSVAKATTDRYAPKIFELANMPADFLAGTGVVHKVSDFVTVTDNYGYGALAVSAAIKDVTGATIVSFSKAANESKPWNLDFAPIKKGMHTLSVEATDASGKKTAKDFALKTYLPAQSDLAVRLFEGKDLELMKGNYYSGRYVDAVPKDGEGTTVSFHYKGGATDNTTENNQLYRQEMLLMNNSPADVSSIDLRWAAIRLNIYVDVRYANDHVFNDPSGTGYGNMGIGFSSYSGILDIPRIEYSMNDLNLQAGWNEVTIKLGRAFGGEVDYNALCEMYVVTNFGSERHFLFNDVRLVETDEFGEWFPDTMNTTAYVSSRLLSKASEIGNATVTLDEVGIYKWNDNIYNGNEIRFPGIIVTDAMGKSEFVDMPKVSVADPAGGVTESIYFKPDKEGKHTITYSSTDWYGKPVTLVKEFNVMPWNAMPVIEYETETNEFNEIVPKKIYQCRLSTKFSVPSLRITDAQGENVDVAYRVVGPNGKSVALDANGKSFRAELPGDYIVTVIATDAVGQVATAEITVKSYGVTTSVYEQTFNGLGWIIGGSVGGGVVLAGAAIAVVLALKSRKKKATVEAQPETQTENDD